MQKISNDELICMRMFYEATGVESLDCILASEGVAFMVPRGLMGKAIGKGGSNMQRLRGRIKRNVFLFEQPEDEEDFVKKSLNVASPQLQEQEKNNKKVIYVKLNASDKYSMKRGIVVTFARELFSRVFGKELKLQTQ
ncbi:MAG: NusA-like transcription termination signal-binding factor [Candidatus Micrarchaeota archaeon]|nr:NusA-like transcription termination signal-binding factor [Candidatus Micrarchaeota archaeon]